MISHRPQHPTPAYRVGLSRITRRARDILPLPHNGDKRELEDIRDKLTQLDERIFLLENRFIIMERE